MLRDPSLVPLSRQHHNGLALVVLSERSLAEDSSPENVSRLAKRAVERFEVELVNHFKMEENVLFPAIESELGDSALVRELIAEHRMVEQLTGRLREQPSRATLDDFLGLLRTHIRKEENELFEDIQRRLARQTLDEVGGVLEAKAVQICLNP